MNDFLITLDFILGMLANLFKVIGSMWVFCVLVKSYRERRKVNMPVEKEFSSTVDEGLLLLGNYGEPGRRLEIYRVVALKSLLSIKDENHAHHLVSRLFFVGIFALAMFIVSKLNDNPVTWFRLIVELVLMVEAIAAFIMASVFGAIFDNKIEKSSAKLACFIETVSKDLIPEKSETTTD